MLLFVVSSFCAKAVCDAVMPNIIAAMLVSDNVHARCDFDISTSQPADFASPTPNRVTANTVDVCRTTGVSATTGSTNKEKMTKDLRQPYVAIF
jgi:hypothetical protein